MLHFFSTIKERARRIFDATRMSKIESPWKATMYAGIQATCGTVLAVYTYKSSTCPIWPFMGSVIAVDGAYKVFKILWEKPIIVDSWRNLTDGLEDLPDSRVFRIGCYFTFISGWFALMRPEEEISEIDAASVVFVIGLFLYESCAEAMSILIKAKNWKTLIDALKNRRVVRFVCYAAVFSGLCGMDGREEGIRYADEVVMDFVIFLVIYDGCGAALNYFLRSTGIEGKVVMNLVFGTFYYATTVKVCSEAWKNGFEEAELFSGSVLVACGYYVTVSAVNSLVTVFNRKPFLKFCLLMFEPALIASTATYLFYFQNYLDKWPYWRLLVVFGAAGLKIAKRDNRRRDEIQ